MRCAGAAKPIRLSSLKYKNLKLKKKEEKKRAEGSLIYRKRARAGAVTNTMQTFCKARSRGVEQMLVTCAAARM